MGAAEKADVGAPSKSRRASAGVSDAKKHTKLQGATNAHARRKRVNVMDATRRTRKARYAVASVLEAVRLNPKLGNTENATLRTQST